MGSNLTSEKMSFLHNQTTFLKLWWLQSVVRLLTTTLPQTNPTCHFIVLLSSHDKTVLTCHKIALSNAHFIHANMVTQTPFLWNWVMHPISLPISLLLHKGEKHVCVISVANVVIWKATVFSCIKANSKQMLLHHQINFKLILFLFLLLQETRRRCQKTDSCRAEQFFSC